MVPSLARVEHLFQVYGSLLSPKVGACREGAPLWGLVEAAALAVGEAPTRRRSPPLRSVEAAVLAVGEVPTSQMAWAAVPY